MGERIHVVVSERQKEDWDEFVQKEPGLDDRSDLVRTAVERYIADRESEFELPDELEKRLEDVLVQFERLEGKLEFANEAFDELQHSQLDEDTVEDIVDFHAGLVRDEIRSLEDEMNSQAGSDER